MRGLVSGLSLCALFVGMGVSEGAAQEAKIRATLATQGDQWVGGRTVLGVDLSAPGIFSSAPVFTLPDPPGILLIPPAGSPTLATETIGGIDYTVQHHEISIFPRRAGMSVVPPLTVRFQFRRRVLDKESVAATVTTDSISIEPKIPPGAEGLGSIISAKALTVTQEWKPEVESAKTGDALTRTITFSAADIPAIAFPPFVPGSLDGVSVYTKVPEVLDRADRGSIQGERRDSVTYVFERSGTFELPAARFTWWDVDAHELRTIELSSQTVRVRPNLALAGKAALSELRRNWIDWVGFSTVTLAFCYAALLFWRNRLKKALSRFLNELRPVRLQPLNPSGPESK